MGLFYGGSKMKQFGMLAHHWNGSLEQVQDWEWSRKYNGWSVIWDGGFTIGMEAKDVPWYYRGKDKPTLATGLWSLGRDNKPKVIKAPKSFTDKLPKGIPCHGEIWYNDRLDVVKRTVGFKQYFKPMWANLKFIAFHQKPFHLFEGGEKIFPNMDEINTPHKAVLNNLRQYENNTFMVIQTHTIKTQEDIDNALSIAREKAWEGVMFSNPSGSYEVRRSWNNLKWKQVYETEAYVFGYEDGKTGKNIGKVGALRCTMTWDDKVLSIYGGLKRHRGIEVDFRVSGLLDDERDWGVVEDIYPRGSKVTFKYSGVSIHGIPQSPNIYRGM